MFCAQQIQSCAHVTDGDDSTRILPQIVKEIGEQHAEYVRLADSQYADSVRIVGLQDSINFLSTKLSKDLSRFKLFVEGISAREIEESKGTIDSLFLYCNQFNELRCLCDSYELVSHRFERNRGLMHAHDSLCTDLDLAFQKFDYALEGSHEWNFKGVDYYVFVTDLEGEEVRLHHKDTATGKRLKSLTEIVNLFRNSKDSLLMVTNAGMYTPKNDPEGLYIENHSELYPIDLGTSEEFLNFYFKPNGVFYVDGDNKAGICESEEYVERFKGKPKPAIATQSGPMLVINGEMHHGFNRNSRSKKIRSGVGVFQGKVVFAITQGKTSFYDFASFFIDVFHCENALFLDGTISKMYLHDLNPNEGGGDFGPILSVSKTK